MDFADRIVRLRKSRALTQKQLASGVGLSEVGIQNYEGRRRKPTYDVLVALADFFDVSIDYLVGRTDKPDSEEKTDKPDKVETDFLGVFRELSDSDRKNLSAFAKFLLAMKENPAEPGKRKA